MRRLLLLLLLLPGCLPGLRAPPGPHLTFPHPCTARPPSRAPTRPTLCLTSGAPGAPQAQRPAAAPAPGSAPPAAPGRGAAAPSPGSAPPATAAGRGTVAGTVDVPARPPHPSGAPAVQPAGVQVGRLLLVRLLVFVSSRGGRLVPPTPFPSSPSASSTLSPCPCGFWL